MDLNKEIKLSDLFRRNRARSRTTCRRRSSYGAQESRASRSAARSPRLPRSQRRRRRRRPPRSRLRRLLPCRSCAPSTSCRRRNAREGRTGRPRQDRCRAARPRHPRRPRRLLPLHRGGSHVEARGARRPTRSWPSSKCRPRSRRAARRRSQPTDRPARPRLGGTCGPNRLGPGSPRGVARRPGGRPATQLSASTPNAAQGGAVAAPAVTTGSTSPNSLAAVGFAGSQESVALFLSRLESIPS